MRMNKFYMPTLREDPQDAEIASHKLLLRAGMIRKTAAGLYSYLPLGYRIVRKVENIVREEMDNYGSQEIHMPITQPREIWEESGRWKTFGPEMFKLKDRNNREFCLGPTAEEYFTDLVKGEIKSYKQLPLNIYQIQTKYRDEKRPRFGINRSREFLMEDSYTFDVDEEAMREAYMNMWRAYEVVFNRLGLEYKIVAGDSGAMGGNSSHEFIALSDVGEGVICYSDDSDFAATDEKAYVYYKVEDENVEKLPSEKVLTPNCKTIEEVSDFLNVDAAHCLKAVDLMVEGKPVIVFIPGDRELNMAKLVSYLKCPEHEIEMMEEKDILALNSSPGFTGPIGLDSRIIIDSRVTQMKNFVVGANEENYHIKNVNYGDDFEGEIVEDLLMVQEGDIDPETKSPLKFKRGIEVGNIFQLGQKYSKSMNATFLDENGKEQFFWMGSYGIGVTRSVSAIVEQNHDDKGMIWPLVVAPYHVIITVVNTKNEEQNTLAEKLYEKLLLQGVEVLLDDRKERVGVKFNDRDLIGIPLRITVGKKASEDIVEFSERRTLENVEMSSTEAYEKVMEIINANLKSVGGLYR
ncbi:MAG: proline--tRNA ligase [Finegoldia magna]|uniref:proline--tRNA ligase n=1 Tax=Finegoldia magna TaxID=1260 RepID=UPI0026F18DBA|nr:proline--tRNA ligase [Finegoldia magna]MBS5777138.1 proline--tRNA ligase [Finegoldia magna]MDU2575271.1 proline--tRNA ligase [Finegoldia magna]